MRAESEFEYVLLCVYFLTTFPSGIYHSGIVVFSSQKV